MNIAILRGTISGSVRITELPGGRSVHNFAVRSGDGDERHVAPVAWHDPRRPPNLTEGDAVVVIGVVRRRWFRAGGGSQSRTEVLATTVARATAKSAARALERAAEELAGSGSFG